MKNAFLILLFAVLGAGIAVYVVAEYGGEATHEYSEEQCTRYCHDRDCPHSNATGFLKKNHDGIIESLGSAPGGTTYQAANLLVFVVVIPVIWLSLYFMNAFFVWQIRRLKRKTS